MGNKRGLFTIIYPFMSKALNLTGLAKECFAVIFGFWISQRQKPVGVSLTTLQTITGGTRPAVVQAVQKLEESKYIVATRNPGIITVYDVTIPEQVLLDFKAFYYAKELVMPQNHRGYSMHTSTSKLTEPRNKTKAKTESLITPLKVAKNISTGGLKTA